MDRQRLGQRMQQSAEAMRAAAGANGSKSGSKTASSKPSDGSPASQEEIARALDRLADSLAASARRGDDESHKLSTNLARTQELRERLDDISRRLQQMNQTPEAQSSRG